MGVSVVATAPSDGSHLEVNGSMTTTVSSYLLIYSRSTTDHSKDIQGMFIRAVIMDLFLDVEVMDH
jgi:hypothetical protein